MKFETLKTERLLLRKMTVETYRYIFDRFNDKQLMHFLGFSSKNELATEKLKFDRGITTFNKSFLIFHLIDPATENVRGWCGYHTWYLDHHRAEIGYVMTNESYKGKGLMKEALRPIIEYGFREMNLNRIEAFIGPDNIPSLKLIEGSGFTREGILREHYFKNGKAEDSVLYSLLKKEFKG